ncbi:MFS transporter [Scopulibacillus cellulosilyticus]|uniref:MFS transporter n=1 Tax=Scopulibacillus cellulosilyticus TaxID=2665665 RepID=A0ABW2PRL2_9BACL
MSIGKARWYRIGFLLFLTYFVAFVDRQNISMAAPDMVKSLGVSSTLVGVLLSAFFWGYVMTQIPGGWVAGKFSAKKVIIAALFIWGIAAMLTGVVHSFNGLIIVRLIMGFAEGVVWPAFAVLFVNWFPNGERARAINFSEMALPISSIVMAPAAGWMIHQWNYHVMFILQGIPPIILALLFIWLVSDSPSEDRLISESERNYLKQNTEKPTTEKEGSLIEVLLNYRVWVFCVIYFLWITGMYSFGLWMPSLMKQLSNQGIQGIGWLSAVPFILATIAMYINAAWSDRRGGSRMWFIATPLLIGGLALIAEHFIGFGLIINMIILIIAGIGIYSAFGPWWAWALSFVPHNQSGSAMGLINLVGNFGGIVGPIVVGIAAGGTNLINGFYILGYALIIGFLLVVLVASRFQENKAAAPGETMPS